MKQMKKLFSLWLALLLFVMAATACGTTPANSNQSGDNSASNAKDKVMLVVSFGTSYNDNRDLSIGGIENALQAAYPDYEIRRAFTSQIIIDKLKDRDNLAIDNVTEAMERLVTDGVKEVVIQPTHVMTGYEYDDVIAEITPYQDKFESFKVGKTLLASDDDYDAVISAITTETQSYNTEGTVIVYMGHGTEHEANATYTKLQQKLKDGNHDRYFIGTVEASPTLEEVVTLVKDSGAAKVVLLPFMIVAGDHANNDMAGDDEDSWKSKFEAEGLAVECSLTGLGQYKEIQDLIVKHAGEAIAQ